MLERFDAADHPFVVNLVVAKVARTRERPFLTAAVSAAMTRANRHPRIPCRNRAQQVLVLVYAIKFACVHAEHFVHRLHRQGKYDHQHRPVDTLKPMGEGSSHISLLRLHDATQLMNSRLKKCRWRCDGHRMR